SGVNVNILTRGLEIPTVDASPAPSVDPNLGASDQTFKPVKVASPMRDDMAAGNDYIDGNGSANEDQPNIIFGDHGVIEMLVVDPNLPPMLLQRIQTTSLDLVYQINSAELQNAGDDTIYGSSADDVLIGNAGNDMIDGREADDLIFGDNVFLNRMGGVDGDLVDDILNLRFQTLAGTLMYSRTDRSAEEGYGIENNGDWEITPYTSGLLMVSGAEDELGNLMMTESGLFDADGLPIMVPVAVARDYRDPNGPGWWTEYEIDYADLHTFEFDAGEAGVGSFGNDYIAGGSGHDEIFGQLGHDVIQGDGTIDSAVAAENHAGAARAAGDPLTDPIGPLTVVAADVAEKYSTGEVYNSRDEDGTDYIEGGGGSDVVFGGLGQDDIVGGSSSFFSLTTPDNRPDENDTIFGGAGEQISRLNENLPGQVGDELYELDSALQEDRHSRDADAIAGDNANIIRLVGTNGVDLIDDGINDPDPNAEDAAEQYKALYETQNGLFLSFQYDTYGSAESVVARGVTMLDYTPGGPDYRPDLFAEAAGGDYRDMFGMGALIDIGGDDEVHGETGDDTVYLQGGNDIAFGDGDNDDVIGGWGHDWISGGTGIDGLLGDDGRIFTSRITGLEDDGTVSLKGNSPQWGNYGVIYAEEHGEWAESLYGVLSLLNEDPDDRTSQGVVLNEQIYTPGRVQQATINVEGELLKSVDLIPFNSEVDGTLLPGTSADPTDHDPAYSDDVIFGGLGDDFMHGGSGDDAIAGGEALEESYAPVVSDPDNATQGSPAQGNDPGVVATSLDAIVRTDFSRPYNPGNLLLFGDGDAHWNEPNPVTQRTGEFFLYDEYDPRRVILFENTADMGDPEDWQVWKDDSVDPTTLRHYFLNQMDNEGGTTVRELEGVLPENQPEFTPEEAQILGLVASYTDFAPNGTPIAESLTLVESDGSDVIFGDLGNDWIVGGTGRDHIYGGFGNDLMNADDVLGGPGTSYDNGAFGSADAVGGDQGLNDTPETHLSWEDRVYGGAGLDILIGNTGGDRLIDALGEFNSYIVPFAPFGIDTVSRQVPPQLWDFLAAQGAGDGADVTRYADTGMTNGDRSKYSRIFIELGEPYGEMGLVTQQDHGFWQDQSGPPTDPQAGNIPGGARDILDTADFDNRTMDAFSKDVGNFTPTGGKLEIAAATQDETAAAVYSLDDYLPSYYEVVATLNLDKPTGGWKSNGYVIFDYYSDVDFKFAGLNISTNKIEMGYVDESGWHYLVQSNKPVKVKPNQDYTVTVAVNGNNVTVAVAGVNWFSYDYTPRLDALGDPIPLNRGMVGVAMDGSKGRVDNFTVQILPPDWTVDETDDFVPPEELTRTATSGSWDESTGELIGTADANGDAVQTIDLGYPLSANSILELEVDISSSDIAGYVFDRYDAGNFKFVALDVANDQVVIGHSTDQHGLVIDASFAFDLDEASTHHLKATMQGAGIDVSVDGTPVTSYGFNAALVDGEFGLLVLDGSAGFDDLEVRTNDAQFADEQALLAAGKPSAAYRGDDLTQDELNSLLDAAAQYWIAAGRDPELLSDLKIEITDLPNQQLGRVDENTIYIDRNAAGYGWFVDSTPFDSAEYDADADSGLNAQTDGHMDLLSVVVHEIGHLLGEAHDTSSLMDTSLEAGVREVGVAIDAATAVEAEVESEIGTASTAADSVVDTLASGNILVTSAPLWQRHEIGNAPHARLPMSVSRDELHDSLQAAVPKPLLVFDQDTGEFVAAHSRQSDSVEDLPVLPRDESGDGTDDWKVYDAADSGPALPRDSLGQVVASAATAIDWGAEARDINFLIPPVLPGRIGIGKASRKQDMA
ncbi:MAG: matrixin family metalloprotease, partial [Gammaproteobacteria bacterium]